MYRGFTLLRREGGEPQLRLAPFEARRDRPSLVRFARDDAFRTSAVLLGRLFYRDDLLGSILDGGCLRGESDAALALAIYRHEGPAGLERLEGEFALAVWDGRRRCLWAQRDPFGCWPLFWSCRRGAVAVGTSPVIVADLIGSKSLDPDALAEFLMQPMPADELSSERTAFAGVQRVRPGTMVGFDHACRPTRRAYWDWADRILPNDVSSLEEAGEQFGLVLRRAVRERLSEEGPTAAHLSGGMDSSSVTCLAREELAARGGAPLHTLSLVHQRRGLGAERPYMELILGQGGPVVPHFLEADEVVYFDWFRRELPRHDEPAALLRSMPNHRCLVSAADRSGALTTLSGEGSDEIVCYQPYHLADRLRSGRWRAALREARRWAGGRNRGMWTVLARYGLEPIWPVWFREGWGPSRRGGYGAWPNLSFFTVPPWVRPEFARRHGVREIGEANARRMFAAPTEVSWNTFMLATTSGDWERWHLAAPLGLNLSHPFRDPRVVCFTLGLPRNVRGVPGLTKPVLQQAMRGVLPEEVRTKPCSPGFDDMYGLGLRQNMPDLERLVRSAALAELGIVDAEKFVPLLHQAALGAGDAQATDRIDKVLSLAAWLDHLDKRGPGEPWHLHEFGEAGRRVPEPVLS